MNITKSLLAMGCAMLIAWSGQLNAGAQGGGGFGGGGMTGGGNFDMSQFMKMMVDNLREPLEVKDDAEWKVLEGQIQKVMNARMQIGLGGGTGMLGMMGRRGGFGGQGGAGGGGGAGAGGPLAALFGSNPEGEALQKAIDANAPNSELKAVVTKFVEARKRKQEALESAQTDLRKLLSVRQEAIAYSLGLL